MKKSIYLELLQHVINTINEQRLASLEDLHYLAFNEDYYIVGYYQAEQWLKEHDVSSFEAIADVIAWEEGALGEVTLKPSDMNAERIVNLYVYVLGEDLLSDFNLDNNVSEVLFDMEEMAKSLQS